MNFAKSENTVQILEQYVPSLKNKRFVLKKYQASELLTQKSHAFYYVLEAVSVTIATPVLREVDRPLSFKSSFPLIQTFPASIQLPSLAIFSAWNNGRKGVLQTSALISKYQKEILKILDTHVCAVHGFSARSVRGSVVCSVQDTAIRDIRRQNCCTTAPPFHFAPSNETIQGYCVSKVSNPGKRSDKSQWRCMWSRNACLGDLFGSTEFFCGL